MATRSSRGGTRRIGDRRKQPAYRSPNGKPRCTHSPLLPAAHRPAITATAQAARWCCSPTRTSARRSCRRARYPARWPSSPPPAPAPPLSVPSPPLSRSKRVGTVPSRLRWPLTAVGATTAIGANRRVAGCDRIASMEAGAEEPSALTGTTLLAVLTHSRRVMAEQRALHSLCFDPLPRPRGEQQQGWR